MKAVQRVPLSGCLFHSDRGVQFAADPRRRILKEHGFFSSMSRRGNPYDNPYAESFMMPLKVEAVYATEYDTFKDVVNDLPRFIEAMYNEKRLHSTVGYISPNRYEQNHAQDWTMSAT